MQMDNRLLFYFVMSIGIRKAGKSIWKKYILHKRGDELSLSKIKPFL